jgi:hypothetical protein
MSMTFFARASSAALSMITLSKLVFIMPKIEGVVYP